MQNRMKTHTLTMPQVVELYERAQIGRIVTQNPDGFPYAVPIHFIYHDGKIYTHGLPKGQKLDNLAQNSKVCFEVDEMISLLHDGVSTACDVNTEFNSAIALGNARLVEDARCKRDVLDRIVEKYTPHLSGTPLPDTMVNGTAVVEIVISECTGKYYR